jgi:hypothetical protein
LNALWWCTLLAAAALSCAASARAHVPDVHLEWQRPVGSLCPSRDVLEADVEALMEREVFTSQGAARVHLRGVVDDGPSGVIIHIEAKSARGDALGTRELRAEPGQCATLRDAIALVLTLFVEYEEPRDESTDSALGLGAEASVAQAPMPRLALALGPALVVAIGRVLELHASAAYWPPVAIQTARGVGAELQALSLELRGCARSWLRGWAGLGLCTGFEGGALIAAPLELTGPERQARLLAHAVVEASWALDLAGFVRVELAAGGLVSLSRPAFSYLRADGEAMAVYRPDLAGVNLRLAIIIPTE